MVGVVDSCGWRPRAALVLRFGPAKHGKSQKNCVTVVTKKLMLTKMTLLSGIKVPSGLEIKSQSGQTAEFVRRTCLPGRFEGLGRNALV